LVGQQIAEKEVAPKLSHPIIQTDDASKVNTLIVKITRLQVTGELLPSQTSDDGSWGIYHPEGIRSIDIFAAFIDVIFWSVSQLPSGHRDGVIGIPISHVKLVLGVLVLYQVRSSATATLFWFVGRHEYTRYTYSQHEAVIRMNNVKLH
jgi:hypothetical protein